MLAAIDNLIFLLLVGVAALLRWLASKASTSGKPNESKDSPVPPPKRSIRQETSSDEEQIRKFLEALGRPRDANAPPPLPPRTNVPPRPVAPVRPPPSAIPIPEIRRSRRATAGRQDVSGPKREVVVEPRSYQPSPVVAPRGDVPAFEVQEGGQPPAEVAALSRAPSVSLTVSTGGESSNTLMQLLRSPDGLRQAVILREIFGPPRSLQPLELTNV